jgi:hypothetical protein
VVVRPQRRPFWLWLRQARSSPGSITT